MGLKMKVTGVDDTFRRINATHTLTRKAQEKVVVERMTKSLRDATPVDTGLARDSWKVTPTLAGYEVENPVPYIEQLNEGSSVQAPARFIERTVLQYANPLGVIVDHK